MTHIRDIFLFELRRQFKRSGYLFTTFGIPLIGLLIFAGVQLFGGGAQAQTEAAAGTVSAVVEEFAPTAGAVFGVVDESGLLARSNLTNGITPYPDAASADAAMDAGAIVGYFRIAADYLETGDVLLVQPRFTLDGFDQTDTLRTYLIGALTEGMPDDVRARLLTGSSTETVNLSLNEEQADQGEGTSFLTSYLFAVALLVGLFVTNGYLLQGVIEEKETRMIEILITSLRPGQLLAGKVLAAAVLGVLQIVVWVGALVFTITLSASPFIGQAVGLVADLADIRLQLDMLPILLLYFIASYLLFASFYAVVGAMSNSMREGTQYTALFTLPAIAPFYFIGLFASAPNETLPTVMSLFPITAPMAMTMRLVVAQVPVGEVILSFTGLALTTAAAIWLAGRIFRAGALLAGQPVRLKDLPALIRG
jgi:ABC-2 type transport system permease protein